ncbi:MAG TPA: histidinol dehydrogenase, partial [Rubrivivax sp.]|nr:histidinol dehydrogenase [Rubrivivax sp.]
MTGAVQIRRLATSAPDFEQRFEALRRWSAEADEAIESRVGQILADVCARGDAALLEYTQRLDGVAASSMSELELGADELRAALDA